ncbi:MAG TPA: hypothetical protein IGS40_06010 [Trichormus sp. M33_DOE_039]|nr:hypothetical protein [Trichormus sp. M33_DOE_039]
MMIGVTVQESGSTTRAVEVLLSDYMFGIVTDKSGVVIDWTRPLNQVAMSELCCHARTIGVITASKWFMRTIVSQQRD